MHFNVILLPVVGSTSAFPLSWYLGEFGLRLPIELLRPPANHTHLAPHPAQLHLLLRLHIGEHMQAASGYVVSCPAVIISSPLEMYYLSWLIMCMSCLEENILLFFTFSKHLTTRIDFSFFIVRIIDIVNLQISAKLVWQNLHMCEFE